MSQTEMLKINSSNLKEEKQINFMDLNKTKESFRDEKNNQNEFYKIYDKKYFDNEIKKWSFKIEASLAGTNIIIPKNSTFTVDILRLDNNQNELAFCSKNNELELGLNTIELLCYTMEEIENDILISLNNIKSDYSSITWTETPNLLDIYMKLELNVELVNKLSFDSKNNKWSFQMIISYIFNVPNNAKINSNDCDVKTISTHRNSADSLSSINSNQEAPLSTRLKTIFPKQNFTNIFFSKVILHQLMLIKP